MIHHPQNINTSIYLDINKYYFYHILTQSLKKRKCDCDIYCKIVDPVTINNLN